MRITRKTQPQQDYLTELWIHGKMNTSWINIRAMFLNRSTVTRYVS